MMSLSAFFLLVSTGASGRKPISWAADYAVDGALLYADYLRKEFDVLAIGVSGGKSVRVSHYLHLKSATSPKRVFGDELLPPADYLAGYRKDPEKYLQDYDALESYIRQLNMNLHTLKVSESNRSLLVSAVLIALERPAFASGFTTEADPKELAKFLLDSVLGNLQQAGVDGKRLAMLRQARDSLSCMRGDALHSTTMSRSAASVSWTMKSGYPRPAPDLEAPLSSFLIFADSDCCSSSTTPANASKCRRTKRSVALSFATWIPPTVLQLCVPNRPSPSFGLLGTAPQAVSCIKLQFPTAVKP